MFCMQMLFEDFQDGWILEQKKTILNLHFALMPHKKFNLTYAWADPECSQRGSKSDNDFFLYF